MTTLTLDPQLLEDGKQLATFGETTLKAALDSILGKTADTVPKVTGDAEKAVEHAIDLHVPTIAQSFVSGLIHDTLNETETKLDLEIVAAIHLASHSVDSALDAAGAKLR